VSFRIRQAIFQSKRCLACCTIGRPTSLPGIDVKKNIQPTPLQKGTGSHVLYIDAGIAYRYSAGTAQEIINSKQDTTFLKAAPISQFFSGN